MYNNQRTNNIALNKYNLYPFARENTMNPTDMYVCMTREHIVYTQEP